MSDTWITVPQAATLVGKSQKTIYNWIAAGHLKTDMNEAGATTVSGRQVLAVEPTIKRGRRPGTARPRIR
ncbi:helix-turn-helix domain-containing protein [Leifsonia sp. WHRI 6310E]|uniref:helix-turn-helix domain-containing protein n=1 Tax=Leifsonia sp. WHRI 6310E TaxID=3162562 RepID=UPI0032EE9850